MAQVIGEDFIENAVPLNVERDGVALKGFIGLPTLNKATSASQYFFVNGRPVRDKVLLGAIKAAYHELLAADRFPALVLFLQLPAEDVDVNVHPTKAEVRFRNAQAVRGMIVTAVRQALMGAGHRTSSTLAAEALDVSLPEPAFYRCAGRRHRPRRLFIPARQRLILLIVPRRPSLILFRKRARYSKQTKRFPLRSPKTCLMIPPVRK